MADGVRALMVIRLGWLGLGWEGKYNRDGVPGRTFDISLRLAFDFQQDTTVREKMQTGLLCYCGNAGFFL